MLWAEYFVRRRFPAKISTKKVRIVGETFRHQHVVVDGKSFQNCCFDGVTLIYRGVGAYDIKGCRFFNAFSLKIENEAALTAFGLVELSQDLGVPFVFSDRQAHPEQATDD